MRITVVIDSVDPSALAPFWAAALGYREAEAPPGYRALVPPERDGRPVVLLQQVPEAKAGKNRVHLDVHPQDPHAHLAMLEGLGARRLGDWQDLVAEAGVRWMVLADPEGNELCLVEHVS
ncbi:VOC family protein [Angustibacter sp. McL0619]|uniref:VOC family protein n=1 Tax=Angustibacter sp. McL0619 TaxID=3415676 RepID=UPI003CED6C74